MASKLGLAEERVCNFDEGEGFENLVSQLKARYLKGGLRSGICSGWGDLNPRPVVPVHKCRLLIVVRWCSFF